MESRKSHMRIEQAIYGEVRSGHALRTTSSKEFSYFELASRLDLPDTAPPGVSWSPFISGFPQGDRYILARTFADASASRAGMVLSHAIIAPIAEITTFADIRPLFRLLIKNAEQPAKVLSLNVEPSSEVPAKATDLLSAADALTSRGNGSVVRIGIQGFEELIVSLWFNLWPEFRERFSFRMSFGPYDLVDSPTPTIVCTPVELGARWSGVQIVSPTSPSTVSNAAAILCGTTDAEPTIKFAHDVGAQLESLRDLPALVYAQELADLPNPDFRDCAASLRLVERLSPHSSRGNASKEKLLERLDSRVGTSSPEDVLLLRNLDLNAIPGVDRLWLRLEHWAANNKFSEAEDAGMLSVIDEAITGSNSIERWCAAVLSGIATAARSPSSAFPAAFWRWILGNSNLVKALLDRLPKEDRLEGRLLKTVPRKIKFDAANAVMEIAQSHDWLSLHGAAAAASLTLSEALRRQLEVDTDLKHFAGLKTALSHAEPHQLLSIAIEIAEPRLLSIAAEEVALRPHLLNKADSANITVQAIWAQALTVNAEAWKGPSDPQASFLSVLQDLLDGNTVSTKLIEELSTSPIADLSTFPLRADVWAKLVGPVRTNLLTATALGWINAISTKKVMDAPDSQLEAAILVDDRLDQVLHSLGPHRVDAVVRGVSALEAFDENRFLQWLSGIDLRHFPITTTEAEALGHLVRDRNWRRVLDKLTQLARLGHKSIRPALHVCQGMIDIFTRWSLALSSVSFDDKWTVLEELAIQLYPLGPNQDEVWERIGGRDSDLLSYGTGRSRWRHAIAKIRLGRGPKAEKLLSEMQLDYPDNEEVDSLAKDSDLKQSYRDQL